MYGLTPTLKNEIVSIAPRARVNSVNPGWVGTPMAQDKLKDKTFVERALATTPLRKVAKTEDVARQVAVVASPTVSGHINGMNVSSYGRPTRVTAVESKLTTVPSAYRSWSMAEWREGCYSRRRVVHESNVRNRHSSKFALDGEKHAFARVYM